MMRQRNRTPTKTDLQYGGPDAEKREGGRLGFPGLDSIVSRRNAIYALPVILFVFVFGPFIPYGPNALYFLASSGFSLEDFVGAGLNDLVNSMVVDPQRVFHSFPETNLVAKREIFLKEFLHYRDTHPLPIISELDPEEQGMLDTEGIWKTLFVRSGGRNTCAAKYFPETVKAADESPFHVLSIMFSRLAPGQVIPPHTGYTKLIQLYHLGLKVPTKPETKPYLTAWEYEGAPEQKMVWEEGKEFVFDDSFVHAAENPSDEERIILFLHLQRIDLKGWRQEFLSGIFHWVFSMIPFAPALSLSEGTEKSCNTLLMGH